MIKTYLKIQNPRFSRFPKKWTYVVMPGTHRIFFWLGARRWQHGATSECIYSVCVQEIRNGGTMAKGSAFGTKRKSYRYIYNSLNENLTPATRTSVRQYLLSATDDEVENCLHFRIFTYIQIYNL